MLPIRHLLITDTNKTPEGDVRGNKEGTEYVNEAPERGRDPVEHLAGGSVLGLSRPESKSLSDEWNRAEIAGERRNSAPVEAGGRA